VLVAGHFQKTSQHAAPDTGKRLGESGQPTPYRSKRTPFTQRAAGKDPSARDPSGGLLRQEERRGRYTLGQLYGETVPRGRRSKASLLSRRIEKKKILSPKESRGLEGLAREEEIFEGALEGGVRSSEKKKSVSLLYRGRRGLTTEGMRGRGAGG